jgi:hypothetical protein
MVVDGMMALVVLVVFGGGDRNDESGSRYDGRL